MSFFRKKSGLEIPPVAPAGGSSNDAARNELLGSKSKRSVSPAPPSYRSSAGSVYNASRDGDPYNTPRAEYLGEKPAARIPDRYTRSTVGDPYARGGNADADRNQLFGGYNPEKHKGPNRFDERGQSSSYDQPGERQFQSQEDEDEEVEGIKQQTRFIKQDSVNSTRNALRIAREAEETARNTLLRLGDQSEKLANTERHLDMGKAHASRAEDRTDELKQLNRSIFRPVITFNKDAKRAAQEAKIQAIHEEQRLEREKAMSDVRDTQNRIGRAATYGRGGENGDEEGIGGRRVRSEAAQGARKEQRKRYQFEATASDDELEDELDDNLDEIGDVSKRLKALAMAAGDELDSSIKRIDGISNKAANLNVKVDINTNRLKRIK